METRLVGEVKSCSGSIRSLQYEFTHHDCIISSAVFTCRFHISYSIQRIFKIPVTSQEYTQSLCYVYYCILFHSDKIEDGKEGSDQGLKRKQEAKSSSSKRKATPKEGMIESDKVLMEIAREIGGKWEEVGVALDIDFKVLRSVVASEIAKADHMKAFYMLQEWKGRAADRFTYQTLASALEEAGLNTCAQYFCYSNSRTKTDLCE